MVSGAVRMRIEGRKREYGLLTDDTHGIDVLRGLDGEKTRCRHRHRLQCACVCTVSVSMEGGV